MNFLFDFDGTICDSLDAFVSIANKFIDRNITHDIIIDQVTKLGIRQMLVQYKIPSWKIPFLVLKARREISTQMSALPTFNGLPEILSKLSTSNTLGIITSNGKQNVKIFLEQHKMMPYFSFVDSSTSLFKKDKKILRTIKKFKLNPKQTYYVGDETRDIEAAKKVGIRSIAVGWGFESKELLKKAKPYKYISLPKQLLHI